MTKDKKIKVVNNMPKGSLGIKLSDGKSYVLSKPGAYHMCSKEDVWHIFNTCNTIQRGYAFIDDKAMRVELGLEESDGIDINALSKKELTEIVEEYSDKEIKELFDADISNVTIEKIVLIARELYKKGKMDAKKMKVIETETGQPIAESDGEEIKEVDDVKPKKKVKRPANKEK